MEQSHREIQTGADSDRNIEWVVVWRNPNDESHKKTETKGKLDIDIWNLFKLRWVVEL